MQKFLITDFETRSKADLKKVGAYEYARDPSTQILCVGWKLGTRETLKQTLARVWSPAVASPYGEFKRAILDPSVQLVAHNSFFEQMITRYVLPKIINEPSLDSIPISRWICTASLAASHALPRSLDKVGEALSLPIQKSKEGHRVMLKLSKPRRPTKNNPKIWHDSISDLMKVMEYCRTDVEAETLLFLTLPDLNETERKVWELDQKINARGFHIDRKTVEEILSLIDLEVDRLNIETRELTNGALNSTTQRDQLMAFMEKNGRAIPDVRAKTVEEALKDGKSEHDSRTRRLLEVRQAISKTSTAKYQAFRNRVSRVDSRVRDILVYHAASTGRWGGAGLNPQNFPRNQTGDLSTALEVVKTKDLDYIRAMLGEPMNVFSSLLRPMITATPGHVLHGGDYASIETRVLFWIADHAKGLMLFHKGEDLYKHMACSIFRVKDVSLVTKEQRQLGKAAILGCGFGMSYQKFLKTCHNQGQTHITEELAQTAVNAYRETHHPVVQSWYNTEQAAIAAVKNPMKKYKVNKTLWWVHGAFLYCELPSKRRLAYYGPEIHMKETPWGEKKASLHHWGVDPLTKKWTFSHTYGARLVENVVQAIARDIMAEAMLRLDQAGYQVVLSVHDEILAEAPIKPGRIDFSTEDFEYRMEYPPSWARDCPIAVETWSGERYIK